MGGARARRLCPQAIVVAPRMTAYAEASRAVFAVFEDTTPLVEALSIDEAFLEVGGLRRISGTPAEIAQRLRRASSSGSACRSPSAWPGQNSWPRWRAASPNPTGCSSYPPTANWPSSTPCPSSGSGVSGPPPPTSSTPGGSPRVGEVAALGEVVLVSILGSGSGRHLHALAHNHDPRPVQTGRRRKSIGSQQALSRPVENLLEAIDTVVVALVDCVSLARTRRRRAGGPALKSSLRLRFNDFSRATRSHTLPRATCQTDPLLAAARALLASVGPIIEARGLTLVGIALGQLDDDGATQLALPLYRGATTDLDAAMDDVRDRFGEAAITRAGYSWTRTGRRRSPCSPIDAAPAFGRTYWLTTTGRAPRLHLRAGAMAWFDAKVFGMYPRFQPPGARWDLNRGPRQRQFMHGAC